MNPKTVNSRIVMLSVPESLRGQVDKLSSNSFSIDPAIPIPAEIPPGENTLDLENLSWEMILSGMIKTIAADPEDDDADYYRRFVLTVKPDLLKEFSEAAILKAKNDDFDIALEILQALEAFFPGEPGVILNTALVYEEKASALEQAGKEEEAEIEYEKAFKLYETIITGTPPFPNGLFNAGFFFIRRHDYERARDCFSSYLPIAEDSKKKSKASAIIKEIDTRNLDDEIFHEAYEAIRTGQEDEGIEKVRDFILRHPDVWNGWFLLGWGLRRLGRWDDGEKSFRKTLELGGDGSDVRNELALCLMELGKLKEAKKELETALRMEPENIKVISNLGVIALKSGKNLEAEGFFKTVLELEPGDAVATEYLGHLGFMTP